MQFMLQYALYNNAGLNMDKPSDWVIFNQRLD